jgi:hypothetical protein
MCSSHSQRYNTTMEAYPLQLGASWPEQLAAIRDTVTDDSGLVREDGVQYRMCRDDDSRFKVKLIPAYPAKPGAGIELEFGMRDLYCKRIDKHLLPDRYPSGIHDVQRDGKPRPAKTIHTLDAYILEVPGNKDVQDRFEKQMLLAMVVAESLRFERIGTDVLNVARAGDLRPGEGATLALNIGAWKPIYDNWGAASAALWAVAPPAARQRFAQPNRLARNHPQDRPATVVTMTPQKVTLGTQYRREVIDASKTMRVLHRPRFD